MFKLRLSCMRLKQQAVIMAGFMEGERERERDRERERETKKYKKPVAGHKQSIVCLCFAKL